MSGGNSAAECQLGLAGQGISIPGTSRDIVITRKHSRNKSSITHNVIDYDKLKCALKGDSPILLAQIWHTPLGSRPPRHFVARKYSIAPLTHSRIRTMPRRARRRSRTYSLSRGSVAPPKTISCSSVMKRLFTQANGRHGKGPSVRQEAKRQRKMCQGRASAQASLWSEPLRIRRSRESVKPTRNQKRRTTTESPKLYCTSEARRKALVAPSIPKARP